MQMVTAKACRAKWSESFRTKSALLNISVLGAFDFQVVPCLLKKNTGYAVCISGCCSDIDKSRFKVQRRLWPPNPEPLNLGDT